MMPYGSGTAAMQSCSTWKRFLWQNAARQFMGDVGYTKMNEEIC
jgi:hypothetical protein